MSGPAGVGALLLTLASACSTSAAEPAGEPPSFPVLEDLDRNPAPGCAGSWVAAVTGRVIDREGAGVAGARPQMCLTLSPEGWLCTEPPTADEQGWFALVLGESNRCIAEIDVRALLPGANLATTYCHAPLAPDDGVLSLAEPLVLYGVEPPVDLPPEGDPDMPRDVILADGLVLSVTPARLFGDYERLRGARVSLAEEPCFIRDVEGLLALYALAPETSTLIGAEAGFPLRMPNTEGLSEGERVELLLLGGLDTTLPDGSSIEEADFEVYGTATVRGDEIVADEGSELPYLSWLGYRRAP